MANPMILFYNLDNETGRKLKFVCLKLKIKIRTVDKSQYGTPVGTLAGISLPDTDEDTPKSIPTQDFTDEMLVFCGFSDQLLDKFLLELKKNRIPRIALKAVLTEQNIHWDSYTLHDELQKEHQIMSGQQ